jgi:hypothetical protein
MRWSCLAAVLRSHGLLSRAKPGWQRRYAVGLAKTLVPGGRYMLYTLDPRKEAGFRLGAARGGLCSLRALV